MHSLYILYSKTIDRYYVGESENPSIRLELHKNHHFKKSFTKAAEDWIIALNFECTNKENALFLEKFIKKMKSRKLIEKVILNPHILTDILLKR